MHPSRTTLAWLTPAAFLMIATATNQLSFASWQTLINNFAVQSFGATGKEIGIQQSIREIPGLMAFTAVYLLFFMREQTLAIVSLAILGVGIAATGFFPTVLGFYLTTLVMSVGFHYYETMNQSLALQWFDRAEAPRVLGRILSAAAIAQIVAFGLIFVFARTLNVSFEAMFLGFGMVGIAAAIILGVASPRFPQKVVQTRGIVLRKRYWLYYVINFMAGARRQIFIVFAAFMMVETFGYRVDQIALLFLVNAVFNVVMAPRIGAFIIRFGERRAILFENLALLGVFLSYSVVTDPWIAAGLYVVDNAFFSLAIAHKTYFQKIADPADIAPTAGVAFTINHIAAVFIPVLLGLVWVHNPSAVFLIGAGFAAISLLLSLLVPRQPGHGNETTLSRQPHELPVDSAARAS